MNESITPAESQVSTTPVQTSETVIDQPKEIKISHKRFSQEKTFIKNKLKQKMQPNKDPELKKTLDKYISGSKLSNEELAKLKKIEIEIFETNEGKVEKKNIAIEDSSVGKLVDFLNNTENQEDKEMQDTNYEFSTDEKAELILAFNELGLVPANQDFIFQLNNIYKSKGVVPSEFIISQKAIDNISNQSLILMPSDFSGENAIIPKLFNSEISTKIEEEQDKATESIKELSTLGNSKEVNELVKKFEISKTQLQKAPELIKKTQEKIAKMYNDLSNTDSEAQQEWLKLISIVENDEDSENTKFEELAKIAGVNEEKFKDRAKDISKESLGKLKKAGLITGILLFLLIIQGIQSQEGQQ